MEFLECDGARLAYERYGARGPWITFIHGGLVASATWRPQLPTETRPNLARAARLVRYDQRGYGESTACPAGDFDVHAGDLLRLWDHLGIERGVLVGFSAGGFIALAGAVQAPRRVAGLVLESCGIPPDALRRSYAERAAAMADDFDAQVAAHMRRAFSQTFVDSQPENIDTYIELARAGDRQSIASTLHACAEWRPPAGTTRLECPALVVSGSEDPGLGAVPGRALCELLPTARQVVVNGAGHTVHYERAPGFNHVVTEFVDECTRE